MKNSYKFALGLLVAVLAIGFSAFTTISNKKKEIVVEQIYYHVGNSYQTTQPEGTTCQADDYFCTVTLNGTSLPSSFAETSIPVTNSNYTVTRQDAKRSWQ